MWSLNQVNYLSLFQEGLFLEFYLVLLFETYNILICWAFFFFLVLFLFFNFLDSMLVCALDKTVTSPGLDQSGDELSRSAGP